MLENSVFHVFRDTLYKVRKKSVFSRDVMQKVWVFFHVFQDTLYKVRRKWEKLAFFKFFLRRSPKSVRKQCFFTFFETLCTKFAENVKNSVFWAFYATFRKKCEKTVFFSRYSRHFVQSSHRIRKNSVFWAFCATFRNKCEKTVFFHVFRDTLYKVRKKSLKTAFFARRYAKSVRKQCSFTFFKTLCTKFVKNVEKQRFWAFWSWFREKCEKTEFFSLFPATFRKKC